eukprot:scaffold8179_cov430-Prasinococcus_capsulatus_cf.AAC.11
MPASPAAGVAAAAAAAAAGTASRPSPRLGSCALARALDVGGGLLSDRELARTTAATHRRGPTRPRPGTEAPPLAWADCHK